MAIGRKKFNMDPKKVGINEQLSSLSTSIEFSFVYLKHYNKLFVMHHVGYIEWVFFVLFSVLDVQTELCVLPFSLSGDPLPGRQLPAEEH